jgi:hypothetical protein
MNKENKLNFNTESLFIDLNNIIQNGVNNLLSDFITNYKLYEETHNCIMNLPSVKREISKSIETYKNDEDSDDLPDLINVYSDSDSDNENDKFDTHIIFYNNEEKPCDSYTRIPVEDDLDQELNDTILCMKKLTNQLLKEKEDINALFQQEINSYKEIIEKCNTEIAELKNKLTSSIVCDLTDNNDEEEHIEIKKEKENIVLHIEEEPNNDVLEYQLDTDEEEEEEDDEEEDEQEDEDVDEEEDQAEAEEEADEEADEEAEEDEDVEQEQVDEEVEVEEEQVDEDVEQEQVDEEDEVETEQSDDAESKNNEEEAEEEEEEEELFEIEIDDVTYCTNDEENGLIYEIDNDGNVGNVIGHFKDSEPFFNKLF